MRIFFKIKFPLSLPSQPVSLKFIEWIDKPENLFGDSFRFLNQSHQFNNYEINWNYDGYGKLWGYNLNYMDYLLQSNMEKERGLKFIHDFVKKLTDKSTGLEPYPISLRGINWIKFLTKHGIRNPEIDNSLFAQYKILLHNLEYHLMGNHLLENGISLLFGAFYFNDMRLYEKAKDIIETELIEQILNDGGHFELSPMYHQIILDRLLDCVNLVQNNRRFNGQESLLGLMVGKANEMLNWLNEMTFSNGHIPLLNDSAPGIAPTTSRLNEYAATLNIEPGTLNFKLSSSGYRKFTGSNYECIVDIGHIGASYQPGHAHADTFNFVLNINKQPCIVDMGISTYEINQERIQERGTASHNAVTICDQNSSGVWSSFRVAQRARTKIIKDDPNLVIAEHDGYRKFTTTHHRAWNFSEKQVIITDTLSGKITEGKAHLWLAPFLEPEIRGNEIILPHAEFAFENSERIEIITSTLPEGFNQYSKCIKIEITFYNHLRSTISVN